MSSQIEGIGATLEDIFDPLLDEHANRDIEDVVNNIKAIEYAVAQSDASALQPPDSKRPRRLDAGCARGNSKPRNSASLQNWIGGRAVP